MVAIFTRPVGGAADDEIAGSKRYPFAPIAAYVVAATSGGVATAGMLALAGALLQSGGFDRGLLVACLAAVVMLACWCEWHGRMRPLPERRAQVPRQWLAWHRLALTAAAFGFLIGAGVFTYLRHATTYVVAATVILAPSLETGLALGAVYGLGRGLSLGITWIGDRFFGRRPGRFQPTRDVTPLNRVAAVVAALTFAIAALITLGG